MAETFEPVQMARGHERVVVRDPFVLAEMERLGFKKSSRSVAAVAKKAASKRSPKKGAPSNKDAGPAPENKGGVSDA